MDLEKIKMTPEAFSKICDILNTNFGNIDLKTLSENDLHYFIATCIEAAYKVGLSDGLETFKS
jgi:hypothetical protein